MNSETTQGESFDLGGRNKKAIRSFLEAFASCKDAITPAIIEENLGALAALRVKTMAVAEQEAKDAAEVDAAMNMSTGNMYVTYAIIAINTTLFILMAINGAGIFETNGLVHIKWGSNYGPLTLSGDWWRLVSSIFIHFGIIHLLMNMYCLYMVGVYLEPMLGKAKFITAYFCTGILANIASLWWHNNEANSAGASGAIFGLYGLFLALLTTSLIPKKVRQVLLQSIGIFIVYNLVYGGTKGGVDNSAHIDGLVSGFVIGYIYVLMIQKEKQGQKMQWIMPAVVLLSVGIAFTYGQQNKMPMADRPKIMAEVNDAGFKDQEKLDQKLQEFQLLEHDAITMISDSTITTKELMLTKLATAKPIWAKCEALLNETRPYDISPEKKTTVQKLFDYVKLRQKENELLTTINSPGAANDDGANKALEENSNHILKILDEIK